MRTNRIVVPSGDQAGFSSRASGVSVTWVGGPPSVGTIHRSVLPPPAGSEEKASRPPSGEKSGKVEEVPRAVTCRSCLPLASITQISKAPVRSLQNAMCLPSGE